MKTKVKVAYPTFCQYFKRLNIGFKRPGQDDCPDCLEYEDHITIYKDLKLPSAMKQPVNSFLETSASDLELDPDQTGENNIQDSGNHDTTSFEACVDFKKNKEQFDEARKEYGKQIPDGQAAFAADMQREILLPKLSSKDHIFVSRLVTFNETFASLNGTYPDFAVLWNESISGRCVADVTSSCVNILQLISADDITIWCGNCSAQNKNRTRLLRKLLARNGVQLVFD